VQRVLITGGAGFIGSNLADRLLADGVQVVVYDNFSTGRHEFLEGVLTHPYGEVVKGDVLDGTALRAALDGCDTVFHLQANTDVRHGLEHPRRDLEQNAMATSELLEAMRDAGATRMGFASSGSVYGEPDLVPTPEDAPMPIQTSLYGASKIAGEGTLHAYCHGFGFTGVVFRFVSILGERYTHGHVIDFYRALRADPTRLRVLGDGRQRKSYLYVGDCVQGMLTAMAAHTDPGDAAVYNLGADETVVVDESVALVAHHLGATPWVEHAGGARGWPGDAPLIHLDCARLRALGWAPTLGIEASLRRTLEWLDDNPVAVREAR
jgi:UDP-glucose 4-epimerase